MAKKCGCKGKGKGKKSKQDSLNHDYCELFKSWFSDGIEQKIIESAVYSGSKMMIIRIALSYGITSRKTN